MGLLCATAMEYLTAQIVRAGGCTDVAEHADGGAKGAHQSDRAARVAPAGRASQQVLHLQQHRRQVSFCRYQFLRYRRVKIQGRGRVGDRSTVPLLLKLYEVAKIESKSC
jgi:hypothetical protein